MKLIIDIPKEFETDYNGDKFKDFFSRVLCDIEKGKCLCGNYEKETAEMFLKAFDESVPMANIVEKLEEREKYLERAMKESHENGYRFSEEKAMNERVAIRYAINIVKQEINNGLE
jgi:hypothetical protein